MFHEMEEAGGMTPDVYTYSSLVSAYAKMGLVENALTTLTAMANLGVKPNVFTCSAVMQVRIYCRS